MDAKQLKEELFYSPKNGRLTASDETLKKADEFCEGYKEFLDNAKTERLAVKTAVSLAESKGFTEFDQDKKYKTGDRFYVNNRGKSAAFIVMGKKPITDGARVIAAHIDSPRLDLKPNPIYEDNELCLFKTHYYGGIKKYQWTTVPLALHGVIVKRDGTAVEVSVGENDDEPCFVVTDLLPHLASEQYKKNLSDAVPAENLNILIGSHPFRSDSESELVKLNILKLLNEKYGIVESDFRSAELECVPVYKARDLGFDRSLIGAYGHDDRVCAYPALKAALDIKEPEHTLIVVLADKEEIGSEGNTGLNSGFLKYIFMDLAKNEDADGYRVMRVSKCLSADVNAGFDPTYPEVMEKRNASLLNYGAVITKYTGSRGKSDTSDASAEFVGFIRNLLDKKGVIWQTGELGKVDIGGGGTVAKYIASLGLDVVDLGVPVLSMHAPFETVAKFDVYMTYLTALAFAE